MTTNIGLSLRSITKILTLSIQVIISSVFTLLLLLLWWRLCCCRYSFNSNLVIDFFSKMFILYLFAQSFTLAFNQEYLSFLEVPSSLISSSTTNTTTPIDEWTMFVLSSPTWFIFSLMNLGMWLQKDIRFPEKVWINILFIVFCLYIFSVLMKIMESSAIIQDDVGIILYIVNKLWFVFYLSPFYALGISASLQ
eukprot:TRINITY_DN6558_c0_g1_i3.p1 TRINITY_DN6558_c0_g1~~TRINITY_DN6558_c0_g1_i3.p1  ORF type:complete len:194 (+),score=7.81 TRINITY_DN6558_c0_g1_i3:384-965(+)